LGGLRGIIFWWVALWYLAGIYGESRISFGIDRLDSDFVCSGKVSSYVRVIVRPTGSSVQLKLNSSLVVQNECRKEKREARLYNFKCGLYNEVTESLNRVAAFETMMGN
jgi:hypothetical protein